MMIRSIRKCGYFFAILACIVVSGCLTPSTSIKSTKSVNYIGSPERLFVLADTVEGFGQDSSDAFVKQFSELAKSCGVTVLVSPVMPLELNLDTHKERMKEFRPDSVLVLQRKTYKTINGALTEVTFDSILLDARTRKSAWRANIALAKGSFLATSKMIGETLAKDLAKELIESQIFKKCPPNQ